jgi:hypothetical protein
MQLPSKFEHAEPMSLAWAWMVVVEVRETTVVLWAHVDAKRREESSTYRAWFEYISFRVFSITGSPGVGEMGVSIADVGVQTQRNHTAVS